MDRDTPSFNNTIFQAIDATVSLFWQRRWSESVGMDFQKMINLTVASLRF